MNRRIGLGMTLACGLTCVVTCAAVPKQKAMSEAEVSSLLNAPVVEPPVVAGSWLKEPTAYRGVPWCASEGAVVKTTNPTSCGEIEPAPRAHRFCSVHGLLAGADVNEVYELEQDRLVSVSIEFPGRTSSQAIELLMQEFGEATRRFREVVNRGTSFEFELEKLRWDGRASTLSFERVARGNAGKVPGGPSAALATLTCGAKP
jgi:hypothetical protein